MLVRKTKSVEGPTDIQALAPADKMPGAKFNFLAADSEAQVLRRVSDIDKRLVEISNILVR